MAALLWNSDARVQRVAAGACSVLALDQDLRTALVADHLQLYTLFDVLTMLEAAAEAHPDSCLRPDASGRSPRELALGSPIHQLSHWAKTVGTLLGRYELVGHTVHASKTCLVIFARDVHTDVLVALKFMANRQEWLREKTARELSNGRDMGSGRGSTKPVMQLDGRHVVAILDSVELDAAAVDWYKRQQQLHGEKPKTYLHIMPQARRDLSDLLSHDRVAGRKLPEVIGILANVAGHLHYLHVECGSIHGDLKPRNIVQVEVELCSLGGCL